VIHTGGVDIGGLRKEVRDTLAHTEFVGNGSEFNFRDPDQSLFGPQASEVYGVDFSNRHTGGCGCLQAQMLENSLPGASFRDLDDFFRKIVPGTVPYKLCYSIITGLNKCVEAIMRRYEIRRGAMTDAEWVSSDASLCNKGYHRSLFRATIAYTFAKELGFSVGLRQHHTQPIPGLGRNKVPCGCGTLWECKLARRDGNIDERTWEEANRRASGDVYLLLSRVLRSMLPDFPLLQNVGGT
jgi:hypothetical protein